MRFAVLAIALLALVLASACRDRGDTVAAQPKETTAAAASAPLDGAMCTEHGVLEAICTKCNPALAAVFKSKGDWCKEHEFPESVCPICHPERGGRPASAIEGDDAPADGTRVRFKTAETARLAGILTAKALTRPVESTCVATARIVYDATRVAKINARASGVVRSAHADVGTRVRRGTALAVIESAAVGAEASSLRSARTGVEVAEANLARVTTLRDQGIVAEREYLDAKRDFEEARAALGTAKASLGVAGTDGENAGRYTLTSPISGVVVRRGSTIGQFVDVDDPLFEVVDTSTVWAELDIPESDLPAVAVGQRVVLRVQGLDDREFTGKLTYVAPEIDRRTRTAVGRVSLSNPGGLLRANTFAEARISVSRASPSVLVPRSAVQRARSAQLVFVRLAEDTFEARRVRVGAGEGAFLAVTGRLLPGDDVATEGSFLLKTETLKGSIGAGCCDVD
jgi:cobalt-zinc-cadmium efflux system membrane fusion protein